MTDYKAELSTDTCTLSITATHKAGCSIFEATAIVEFLTNYPWILGALLIAFGFIVTFFGGKLFPYVLSSVAGGATFLILMILLSTLGALDAL